jgi:hypothetical protein
VINIVVTDCEMHSQIEAKLHDWFRLASAINAVPVALVSINTLVARTLFKKR